MAAFCPELQPSIFRPTFVNVISSTPADEYNTSSERRTSISHEYQPLQNERRLSRHKTHDLLDGSMRLEHCCSNSVAENTGLGESHKNALSSTSAES